MDHAAERLAQNLADVRGRVAAAARRAGRPAESVTLVGVSKYVSAEMAAALFDAGCTQLGESRPQELWDKSAALADRRVNWHLIGHLQRNKIRRTLPLLSLLQSVDSRRLLTTLEAEAAALNKPVSVLLEVNVSGDIAKTGLAASELPGALEYAAGLAHVAVRGLMGMASLVGGLETARRDFAKLQKLRERLISNCPPNVSLAELSMGMSGDFEVAIEEGATIVRVGSALFEGLEE